MLSPDAKAKGIAALRNSPAVTKINRFLACPTYILTVSALALAGNLFALELPVYTLYVAIGIYLFLLGEDLLPLMPLVILCYIVPSVGNNPGLTAQSIFALERGGIYLLVLAGTMVVTLLVRLLTDKEWGRKAFFTKKRALTGGFLLLSLTYLASGIGSDNYKTLASKNLIFAFVQAASVALPYLLFSGGVDWKKVRKDYFAWIGFGVGCVLLGQILWTYATTDVVVAGSIERKLIFTGWGMYNNMGGLLAMMIPFPFYLASRFRKGWIGSVVGTVFLVGVLLTCSRSSILTGCAVYALCIGLMIFSASNRHGNAVALITVLSVMGIVFLIFRGQLVRLFAEIIGRGLDPNSRDMIFKDGWNLFLRNPVFGNTFYPPANMAWSWSTNSGFTSFFPARWHNTFIQLLASCGVMGLGAYLLHRVQTIRVFLRDRTREKAFIACSLAVLLITSLFDCHFFNIGPALFYSMALAFGENCVKRKLK